ncbi:hypothetical protein ACIPLC_26640 [Kitasatospora sp. NPDC086801]|uniref:hypothetical protein n=1 Tax=Kitasatospora sp. NPDC086801 TaxID=3364066 RepID=UPI0037F6EDAC
MVPPAEPFHRRSQQWPAVPGKERRATGPPGYAWNSLLCTPKDSAKPCDPKDPGQHWVIFNDQISLANA